MATEGRSHSLPCRAGPRRLGARMPREQWLSIPPHVHHAPGTTALFPLDTSTPIIPRAEGTVLKTLC